MTNRYIYDFRIFLKKILLKEKINFFNIEPNFDFLYIHKNFMAEPTNTIYEKNTEYGLN